MSYNMKNNASILLIDDQPEWLDVYGSALKEAGCQVLEALGGKAGLATALAAKPKPDLILLDMAMPDMDGMQVLKELKDDLETKDIKVAFFTSFAAPGQSGFKPQYAAELGAVAVIPKGISRNDFLKEVEKIIP
jgi:CheY-like chemotaxis protein